MPIFKCTKCGCAENTACCHYWGNHADAKDVLCSECDPDIGVWHGLFPKRSAEGMIVNEHGYLENPKAKP